MRSWAAVLWLAACVLCACSRQDQARAIALDIYQECHQEHPDPARLQKQLAHLKQHREQLPLDALSLVRSLDEASEYLARSIQLRQEIESRIRQAAAAGKPVPSSQASSAVWSSETASAMIKVQLKETSEMLLPYCYEKP